MTDKGVQAIAKNCTKLQVFICNGLQTGSGPVSLRKCGVTEESLSHLKKYCPSLRVLSMLGIYFFMFSVYYYVILT